VKLITERIKSIVKDKKAPIFLTGDFNSDISSDIFVPLKKVLKQARKDAPVTDNKGTYNGWGSAANIFVIDHIFYKNAKPLIFKTLDSNIYGRTLISDHYPIKGIFVL
jgi:endonuclease/exonuclease/phosphatase family metal-dependent hydrolase